MTAVEHTPSAVCPDCGAPTEPQTVNQPALLRHAGYGADRTTIVHRCTRCDWSLLAATTETKPVRRATT